MCTFCLWPQTHSGHRWRLRSTDDVANEVRYALEAFPQVKEIFFDDDTFNYQKARTIELCKKLKPLNFTWSCTSRVTTDYDTLKAMKDAGCRLLIVGYESGDQQILKNIKKGATVEMAERFTANCKKLGLLVHGDFIIGLPGETRESIRKTIDFAKRLDNETIQVSIAHPYPGTEFYDYVKKNDLITIDSMTDESGHQLPNIIYPGLDRGELAAPKHAVGAHHEQRLRRVLRRRQQVAVLVDPRVERLGDPCPRADGLPSPGLVECPVRKEIVTCVPLDVRDDRATEERCEQHDDQRCHGDDRPTVSPQTEPGRLPGAHRTHRNCGFSCHFHPRFDPIDADRTSNVLPRRNDCTYASGMKTGTFLGVPYDWRRPTVERLKSRWWNPAEPRLFTPKTFGWGYDINLARLLGLHPGE